eukprot:CAMPEP_0181429766 /NCGR_PEP_ID=MMETSP1110-20121109/17369_1 /TAXON_ID=174948 /ORGANISM="Symbiodinium sp., Strain CCMP421" /LENGTH=32 /DNA_ID= /DNA_START= /DNA_END= /DNA_ORIENTATION=
MSFAAHGAGYSRQFRLNTRRVHAQKLRMTAKH